MSETTQAGPVVILAGGLSHEREVSLRSGRRVAQALRDRGVEVIESDLGPELLPLLSRLDHPVVFPMLHGGVGEDGGLAEVLDLLGVAYVGSPASACRRAFNKEISGPLIEAAGLARPQMLALPHDVFRELGAAALVEAVGRRIGFPLIVKPARSGSALGCTKVERPEHLPQAMVAAYAYGDTAIIEGFVTGVEVAVSVLEVDGRIEALPAVQVEPSSGIFDYTARYTAGETRFVVPAELDAELASACAELALAAHRVLGLRDYSRSDLIVAANGPVFLEANSAPGMTETSLLPQAIEASGRDLADFCLAMVANARARQASAG